MLMKHKNIQYTLRKITVSKIKKKLIENYILSSISKLLAKYWIPERETHPKSKKGDRILSLI